ncbi:transposase [Alicyclobacillus cycloheptanicus]|uniref:Transposase-like protein n=1 Tax=Alicyclobacillus cycloheptanicus TaxID=1457 RepID=A0ABT9XDK6_9BACL|nr:transposase [Alicyclobacillus cycloheptanicus]MDQ0188377.1 transposase-like protein [Alicyclobacillus cycloheptanicus]WDM01083.1 transposase [Alicyclobacillus cycloheptanicus]
MERRNFSVQFKQQIVRECSETGNVSLVARKHDLNANMVRRWIKQVNGSAKSSPKTRGKVTHAAAEEMQALQAEQQQLIAENERMKKTMGEQALKFPSSVTCEKMKALTCG